MGNLTLTLYEDDPIFLQHEAIDDIKVSTHAKHGVRLTFSAQDDVRIMRSSIMDTAPAHQNIPVLSRTRIGGYGDIRLIAKGGMYIVETPQRTSQPQSCLHEAKREYLNEVVTAVTAGVRT